jgi:hypothetical protein
MSRDAKEVMDLHLRLRRGGEFDRDLEENYHPDVIVLTARAAYRGHDGVRRSAHLLWKAIEDPGAYTYDTVMVEDRFALLEWQAKTEELNVNCGVDSYLIEDGQIVGQSIHYRVENLELSVSASTITEPHDTGPSSEDDHTRMAGLTDGGGPERS